LSDFYYDELRSFAKLAFRAISLMAKADQRRRILAKAWTAILCALWAVTSLAQNLEIYVSDAGKLDQPPWQILKYDANGENPEVFINQNLAWPQDILFLESENTVLVSNLNTNRITRYHADTGEFMDNFITGIAQPTRMKIGADGLLYVLQWSGDGKVRRYQLDGTFVDNFTDVGVDRSIGFDWDTSGNLYVSSYGDESVRKFNSNGQDQGLFINSNLEGPTNIWFNEAGELLVTDWRGTSVKRFDANGNFLGDFITGLSEAEGVDFLPNGNILIGNGGTGAVKMYQADGTYIEDLVPSGFGGLIQPNAIVVRPLATGFVINAGLNDAWFNAATPGQGFFVTVFPNNQQIFLAWFTYDSERPDPSVQSNLGEPGHRWLTAFGSYSGDTANLNIEITKGGVFDSMTPMPAQENGGTIEIQFSDCENGLLTYDMPAIALSGSIPISRIALDNVALCEGMAAAR